MIFNRYFLYTLGLSGSLFMASCDSGNKQKDKTDMATQTPATEETPANDVHTYAQPQDAVINHLDLDIQVNFDKKIISGIAAYNIENVTKGNKIIFDARNLNIKKVYLDGNEGNETSFTLGDINEFLGQPLEVEIKPETQLVTIEYETSPEAAALQWLNPQQTAGKKYPFLFTQSQAILARTWIPIQDSPGIRFTYNANVQVPKELLAVMSAENPQQKNNTGSYSFAMKQPIPSYLMALSVGDMEFKSLGEHTGVYAEPATIKEAAYEFAELDKMLEAAEKLYGKYRWDRYDLLVLPPSFPFGGMENPRLTFVTPTILAKDRSLTSLIAHELAHSWSGNLVTNATWNDFWLNEGFTVYFERRIMEEIYGKEYADMLHVLGMQDLMETLEEKGESDPDTRLKLELEGRDPDEGLTDIAYEKGNYFLLNLEKAVGREKFDQFLNNYFNTFAFKTTTTSKFVNFLEKELIKGDQELAKKINVQGWIYEPGLPANRPEIKAERFKQVEQAYSNWKNGTAPQKLDTKNWSSHEWLHFIRMLPEDMTIAQMTELDKAFGFTNSGNSEILAAWLLHTIRRNYKPADQALENFLVKVGRRKFLVPLYKALIQSPEGTKRALEIYAKARPNYHTVSTHTLDDLLKQDSN